MKKFAYLAAAAALSVASFAAQAESAAVKGKMLYGAGGTRLGNIARVTQDGSAQIIIDGKLVTIPASSITAAEGKVTTSLTKNDVIASR
jgi:hypothetical protein